MGPYGFVKHSILFWIECFFIYQAFRKLLHSLGIALLHLLCAVDEANALNFGLSPISTQF